MDFPYVAYPEALMETVERDAVEAEGKRRAQLQSIFPKVEALLVNGEYRRALLFFADRERLAAYPVSLVDFLLCELYPEVGEGYDAYMADAGDQLKELVPEQVRRAYERTMLLTLGILVTARRDRPDDATPAVRWTTVVKLVRDLAAVEPKFPMPLPQ